MKEKAVKTMLIAAALIFVMGISASAEGIITQEKENIMTEEVKKTEEKLLNEYINSLPNKEYSCIRVLDDGTEIAFHHYTEFKYTEPTCTSTGYKEYTCDICREHIKTEIPQLLHNFEEGICKSCGKEETIEEILDENTKGNTGRDIKDLYEEYISYLTEEGKQEYLTRLNDSERMDLLDYIRDLDPEVNDNE